jgi:hypothetical protein
MQRHIGPILRGNLSSDKRFDVGTGPSPSGRWRGELRSGASRTAGQAFHAGGNLQARQQ